MKILYAADNRPSSYMLLDRFVESIKNKNMELRIAAYKKSSGHYNIDYTLDCLLNFTNSNSISRNGNYSYYKNEISRFSPDLIISDLEIYSSLIGLDLGISLWQVSPVLLYFGISKKLKMSSGVGCRTKYFFHSNFRRNKIYKEIINKSNRKFIVSHLCDTLPSIELNIGFEWLRPDFILSDESSGDKTSILSSEISVSDAFYNQIPYELIDNANDIETMIIKSIDDLLINKQIKINEKVKFLHQWI